MAEQLLETTNEIIRKITRYALQIIEARELGASRKNEYKKVIDLFFKCDCSKEKLSEALITVGKDELQAMINEDHGCQLHCQFCNTEYNFSEDELKEIIEKI